MELKMSKSYLKFLFTAVLLISLFLIVPFHSMAATVSCQNAMVVETDKQISDTTIEKDVYIKQGASQMQGDGKIVISRIIH